MSNGCSSCQKNQENLIQNNSANIERVRIVVNKPTSNLEQKPASPKFQIPKVLPPLK